MTKLRSSALFLGAVLAAMVTVTGVSGCDDNNNDQVVFTAGNCSTACNRYQACFNPSYDVAACTNRCQAAVNNNSIVSTDVDDCINCVGANVCTPAYVCTDACDLVIVVP